MTECDPVETTNLDRYGHAELPWDRAPGPAPWYLYRLTYDTVFGFATAEPHGATRWRFDR